MGQKTLVINHKNLFSWVGKPLYYLLLLVGFIIGTIIFVLYKFCKTVIPVTLSFLRSFFTLDREIFQSYKDKTSNTLRQRTDDLSQLRIQLQTIGRRFPVYFRTIFSGPFFSHPYLLLFNKVWLPLAVFCIVTLSIGNVFFGIYDGVVKNLPQASALRSHTPPLTTRIYDRNGILLYSIYKDENRSLIKLSELPSYLPQAFVSMEDQEFFEHKGISFRGLARAAQVFFFEPWHTEGGSTITQQLVKNIFLTNERTFSRKLKEMIIAIQVEREFSKEEILEMYLNEVSFGGSIYGVEEAAKTYFGKHAKELSLEESAYLAGLPQAPSVYTPYGTHPELGIARQHEVLRRLFEDGKISAIQFEQVKNTALSFIHTRNDIKAPHFVMYVREKLAKELGEQVVAQGGLEVYTTLDLNLQTKVQEIVTKEVNSLKNLRISNGAALVTDPRTGEILAMVGSKDYFDTKNDGQVNVTERPRQPGSAIKPLTYAAAFERGFTPATLIEDTPISIPIPGSKPYAPVNYDNSYHGNVSVRRALASSYNIPAVKTLMSIGVPNLVEKAKSMGISTWNNPSRYGLSITLGAAEVYMTDMSVAYSTFVNAGVTVPLQYVKEIKDSSGKTVVYNPCIQTKAPCGGKKTLDPRIAYQIVSILSDNVARSPAFGLHSVLNIPNQQVMVKTGTTNGLRDNWTFGGTTERLVATWVGNNDNSPMSKVTSGVIGASPIWSKIISQILDSKSPHVFPVPDGIVKISMCGSSGRISCGNCGSSYDEYFLPGTEPAKDCRFIAQQDGNSVEEGSSNDLRYTTPTPTPVLLQNPRNVVNRRSR